METVLVIQFINDRFPGPGAFLAIYLDAHNLRSICRTERNEFWR